METVDKKWEEKEKKDKLRKKEENKKYRRNQYGKPIDVDV